MATTLYTKLLSSQNCESLTAQPRIDRIDINANQKMKKMNKNLQDKQQNRSPSALQRWTLQRAAETSQRMGQIRQRLGRRQLMRRPCAVDPLPLKERSTTPSQFIRGAPAQRWR